MNIVQRARRLRYAAGLICAMTASGAMPSATPTEDPRGLHSIALSVPGQARSLPLYGESHALVIGAADYHKGWPTLPGAREDVDAVAKALEKQGFTVTREINPSGDKLDKTIKRFVSQNGQKKDSRLLIYYAGHGHTLKPDADRQLGYLVPVDAPLAEEDPAGFIEAALSMETLEGYAKQIRSKHALFVFDACFSGSYFKMRAAPEIIALKTGLPVRQFISSGSADQQVPDVSIFRRQFVAALNGEGDLNRDGYLTGSELGSFLEDRVSHYSRSAQIPQYGKIRDPALDKGDFVFVLNPAAVQREEPGAPPPALKTSGISLEAIRKQQALRDGWLEWQNRMRTDYQQVEAMHVAPELKARAWAQFLAAYTHTNPYSDEADTLRQQARAAQTALAKSKETRMPVPIRAGESLKDCPECPELRVIPAGQFIMGSDDHGSEQPPHRVQVARFALGKTEVTQGQWRALMGNNPGKFSGCGDDCPVEQVSWDDAQAYVKKLLELTGQTYRLPTEAEWEYAARADTTTRYWWGDQASHEYMNYGKDRCCGGIASGRDQWVKTAPVGQFPANAFGLQDMNGNVQEWVEDCWHDNHIGAPDDGSARTHDHCPARVLRGGSWFNLPSLARAAYRTWASPAERNYYLGFRVARTVGP